MEGCGVIVRPLAGGDLKGWPGLGPGATCRDACLFTGLPKSWLCVKGGAASGEGSPAPVVARPVAGPGPATAATAVTAAFGRRLGPEAEMRDL